MILMNLTFFSSVEDITYTTEKWRIEFGNHPNEALARNYNLVCHHFFSLLTFFCFPHAHDKDLPAEIFRRVVFYMGDKILQMSLVCKHWYEFDTTFFFSPFFCLFLGTVLCLIAKCG
jgi:hypothetical protein